MRFSRSSLHLKEPTQGTSRSCSTARTCESCTGRLASAVSIRTKRKPLGPTVFFPSQGRPVIWSRTAWSFPPPRSFSSDIASLTLSPKRIRTGFAALSPASGVKSSTLPTNSVPKSSRMPAGLPSCGVSTQGGCGSLSTGCPGFFASKFSACFTPASDFQTMRIGAMKNDWSGDFSARAATCGGSSAAWPAASERVAKASRDARNMSGFRN